MSIHLKLEIASEEEKKQFAAVKKHLGINTNTEIVRHLLRECYKDSVRFNKIKNKEVE